MRATFVLSTGRCGTQSLTDLVGHTLRDRAIVAHEPIRAAYKPRLTLRSFDPGRDPQLAAAREHIGLVVTAVSKGVEYVEAGWPAFPAFEHYHERLGGAWRYLHLVRNPVHVAASFATHRYYQESRDDDYARYAIIHPTDDGATFPEFASEWAEFSVFDKCLYQWLEINGRLSRLVSAGLRPVAQVRFEEFFADPTARERLFERLGWPRPAPAAAHADKWHRQTDIALSPTSDRLWQKVEEMAAGFGYEAAELRDSLATLRYDRPRQ